MSSPFQVVKQLRHLIRAATWADSPSALVVGSSCYATPGILEDSDLPPRFPFVLLNAGSQTADPEDPNLLTQEVIVVLAAQVVGDPLGEHALTGGPSSQGTSRLGRSEGRGLLDLETAILGAVGRLTGADGVPILVSQAQAPAPEKVGANVHLVYRQYTLAVVCSRADEYAAPRDLTVGVTVAGQADLAWVLPPATYGRRQIVCRRASGSTAPTSATAGTGVTLAGDLSTSVSVTGLASGAHSFALFAGYTESGAASNERYSSQVTGSYRTATVT